MDINQTIQMQINEAIDCALSDKLRHNNAMQNLVNEQIKQYLSQSKHERIVAPMKIVVQELLENSNIIQQVVYRIIGEIVEKELKTRTRVTIDKAE